MGEATSSVGVSVTLLTIGTTVPPGTRLAVVEGDLLGEAVSLVATAISTYAPFGSFALTLVDRLPLPPRPPLPLPPPHFCRASRPMDLVSNGLRVSCTPAEYPAAVPCLHVPLILKKGHACAAPTTAAPPCDFLVLPGCLERYTS
jgi:hypothetical protein